MRYFNPSLLHKVADIEYSDKPLIMGTALGALSGGLGGYQLARYYKPDSTAIPITSALLGAGLGGGLVYLGSLGIKEWLRERSMARLGRYDH